MSLIEIISESAVSILALLLAIVLHEIGHWIIPYYKGLNPKLKVGWIVLGIEFDYKDWVPIKMLIDTRILAITLGIIPILILGRPEDLFFISALYLLFSFKDILMIISIKIRAHQKNAHLWCELDWR